jgi:hypothetical protein
MESRQRIVHNGGMSVIKFLAIASLLVAPLIAQTADPHSIPAVDAALGSCSADFTINDDAGKPVYAAKIEVRVAYGFMSAHKLDLEVGTNVDGKARFTGLPGDLKHGLFFRASESDRTGTAFADPSKTCKSQFTVTLRKQVQQ